MLHIVPVKTEVKLLKCFLVFATSADLYMFSTHWLHDVFILQNFLQLLSFPLQVGALGPGSSGRTLALHGFGSFAKVKVPNRDGVNHNNLHGRVADRWSGRQTCLLPDVFWLGYTCDGFLLPLLALCESGNYAT